MSAHDEAVRATNDDAASCKRSAVQLGYWTDPYIQYVTKASDHKPPEISRGYYARVKGIQGLVRQFIQMTGGECQVVNLGAGSDTWFWNLVDEGKTPKKAWVEVDFGEVTARKIYNIRSRRQLLEKIASPDSEVMFSKTDIHSGIYHLVACDLRDIDTLSAKLDACGVDRRLPTVFIAECVFVYMSAESSSSLAKWIAEQFNTTLFVSYEQVNMSDRFGKVMIENLEARGCSLSGVEHCLSLDTQKARFTSNGWQSAQAATMMTVYDTLPGADLQRVEKLEMLDDRDMLTQLCEHYCLCWAYISRLADSTQTTAPSPSLDLSAITLNNIT